MSEKKRRAYTVAEQMALEPAPFQFERQDVLDQKTDSWLNRTPYQYDMESDPFYKQYKDQYTKLGAMAMEDTMGKASSLTGGYANSYAQSVGQQAYDSYLQQLNNIMPELYAQDRAAYEAEGQQLYNEIALLESQRAQAYGEHQDEMNEWYNWLGYLQEKEAAEAAARASYSSDGTSGYDPDIDKNVLEMIEGQDPAKRDDYIKSLVETGILDSNQGLWASTVYAGYNANGVEEEDPFVQYVYQGKEDGKSVFNYGGKTVSVERGLNPYTGTRNADAKNGTFSNGYQPNNVGGKKLSKTGDFVWVNGVQQNVWKTPDGTRYIWDGTKNRYLKEGTFEYENE